MSQADIKITELTEFPSDAILSNCLASFTTSCSTLMFIFLFCFLTFLAKKHRPSHTTREFNTTLHHSKVERRKPRSHTNMGLGSLNINEDQ